MTKQALLVVDVQNDFTEGGALAVAGGAKVAAGITATLLRPEINTYDLVVASRDWHNAAPDTNEGHFAAEGEEPNFVTTWPVHCVAGTPGADYHPDLVLPSETVHIFKGQGRSDYSAFQGVTADGRGLRDVLTLAKIEHLDVVGIATDHCVLSSVLDALKIEGLSVQVISELTAGVAPEPTLAAEVSMVEAGATFGAIGLRRLDNIAAARVRSLTDDQLVPALHQVLRSKTLTATILGLTDQTLLDSYLAGDKPDSELVEHVRQVLQVIYFLSASESDAAVRSLLVGTSSETGNAPALDLRAKKYEETKTGFASYITGGY